MKIFKTSEDVTRSYNREKKSVDEALKGFTYIVLGEENEELGTLSASSSGYVNISLNFPSNLDTREMQKKLEEWLGAVTLTELQDKEK